MRRIHLAVAVVLVLFVLALSLSWQGFAGLLSGVNRGETNDLRKSELREKIFQCREVALAAGVDVSSNERTRLRQMCQLLEIDFRSRYGESP